MSKWLEKLAVDPIPTLLAEGDPALAYFTRRDLLGEGVEMVENLWELPAVRKLMGKQKANGAWKYPGKDNFPGVAANYDLFETYRSLRVLVGMYGLTRAHPAMAQAAEYVFSCQTEEGDLRGILGNQYIPYYHGALLEVLINAGYSEDARVIKGLEWLLSMRQDDGAWIIPFQMAPAVERTPEAWNGEPIQPQRDQPFSHMATSMVIRAFAAHPVYRKRAEAHAAGTQLKMRFFKSDKYNDRKTPAYWLKFHYPFFWGNLLTALDSLAQLGFPADDADIQTGLNWFLENQQPDGLWNTGYGKGGKARQNEVWVCLAVCRVSKRFFG